MGDRKGVHIELAGDWKRFRLVVLGFKGNLRKSIRNAHNQVGHILVAEIKRRITRGQYAKNTPLTQFIKEHSKPKAISSNSLMFSDTLRKAITHEVEGIFGLAVGVERKSSGGANVAEILHDGATFTLTPKAIRNFSFIIQKLQKESGATIPKSASTTPGVVRIKGRPFIEDVFNDPAIMKRVQDQYLKVLKKAVGE